MSTSGHHEVSRGFNVCVARWPGPVPYFDAYRELAETLRFGLARLRYDVTLSDHRILAGRSNIVLGFQVLDASAPARLPPQTIFYNLEQITGEPLKPVYHGVGSHVAVWDYSLRNCTKWRELGAGRVVHVPVGMVPEMRRITPASLQDIDVLFYGLVDERRRRVLEQLRAAGLRVSVLQGVYGPARDAYVARARVVLNMHLYATRIFEIVRVSYLLANSKAVVAECAEDTEIETSLRAAVRLAPYEELADTCIELVRDDSARQQLEQRGFGIMSARDECAILARALRES